MKVTFKDVGQGDSIMLEWNDGGKDKVAIIDCNRKSGKNPVKDHIEASGYKEIEFLILSHPHSDHYSGMNELFDFVEKNNITIKSFGHTLFILGPDFYRFLKWVEVESAEMEDLQKLVTRIDELRTAGHIRKIEFISEKWTEQLSEDIELRCISPGQTEAEHYMKGVKYEPDKNKKKASESANYLSTMFCLVRGEKYFLLTADTETVSMERLLAEQAHKVLRDKYLYVAQLPHHGSAKNRHDAFWDSLKKNKERHAVASAGYNLKYQHPDLDVMKVFFDNEYSVTCTNIYHGSKEFLDYLIGLKAASDRLDTVSSLIDNYVAGEKVYHLQ